MINSLGNPKPFIRNKSALGKRAQLSMARSEVCRAEHGQNILAETLVAVDGRQSLRETVDRTPIVGLGVAS